MMSVVQFHQFPFQLFYYEENFIRKAVKIIKLISRSDFEKLISSGIIGKCHMYGNDGLSGKHSCGYYDVKRFEAEKKRNSGESDRHLKTVCAHVGVAITKNGKIYIEDSYVK